MASRFNATDRRRPLSFPAVHACEGISPSTLVASLITLTQNICNFELNSFRTQRRNAREILRQMAILLVFFQEVHDGGSVIPNPVIVCFSELHLTFQKIHFLIRDCTREDTRLWMLMNSQFVAMQFRTLIRAVSTALDAIPPRAVEVCREVKELVELVTKQARKAKFELDPDDEREMKRVHLILDQFERGTEPKVEAMKQVLDYLGINTWNDCKKEVKFLEEEFDSNERDAPLLSSLTAFLCYCRVVIFETLDFQSFNTGEQSEAQCSTETLSYVMPEDFRCPISLELMTDPVTISTGQTYNRSSIQKWFKAGHVICPKTGERLTSKDMFPNETLKKLIDQFCLDNGISIAKSRNINHSITRTIEAGSPAAAQAIQHLSWFLSWRLVFGTEEQKNKAAYEIRLLARSNIFNRACLVEIGTVPPLLDLLATDDRTTQENAIGALLKLSKHPSGREIIMESRGLMPIVKVLKRGNSLEARQLAAATIFYLSSVKEYRKIIGENADAIPGLVETVKEGAISGKKNAVVAIFGLLLLPRNHPKVLAAGAVPALVEVLASSHQVDLVTDCLAVLVALAESGDGSHAVFRASALPLVNRILQSETSRAGKEYCVSILLALCVNIGVEIIEVLAKDISVMPSLYSLLTDGTPHAAKKARQLINLLHEFNEKRNAGRVGSSVSQHRMVRLS